MNKNLLKFFDNSSQYIVDFEKEYESQLKEENKKELFLDSCGLSSVYSFTGDYKSLYNVIVNKLVGLKTKKEVLSILETALIQLKTEHNKLFEDKNIYNKLRDYGIDLTNFENYYEILLINLVSRLSGKEKDEVEWWLYENVEKIYYLGEKEYNVEKAIDFLSF